MLKQEIDSIKKAVMSISKISIKVIDSGINRYSVIFNNNKVCHSYNKAMDIIASSYLRG